MAIVEVLLGFICKGDCGGIFLSGLFLSGLVFGAKISLLAEDFLTIVALFTTVVSFMSKVLSPPEAMDGALVRV